MVQVLSLQFVFFLVVTLSLMFNNNSMVSAGCVNEGGGCSHFAVFTGYCCHGLACASGPNGDICKKPTHLNNDSSKESV